MCRVVGSPHSYKSNPVSHPWPGHVDTPIRQDTHFTITVVISLICAVISKIKGVFSYSDNILMTVSYHLSPARHLNGEHTQASTAAAVLALLIVYMNSHFLVGLQHKWHYLLNSYLICTHKTTENVEFGYKNQSRKQTQLINN